MNSDTTPTTQVIGLIMAAGLSRRFGSDKRLALLPGGETLLSATLALARRHFTDTRVVIRTKDDAQALGLPKDQAVIRSPEEDIGLGTSLGNAFSQLLNESTDALATAVMLADMPWITDDSLTVLIQAADAKSITRPRFEGRVGHPVIFGRRFWRELASLRGDQGAASVVKAHAHACRLVDTDDQQVLGDIDKPSDISHNGTTK